MQDTNIGSDDDGFVSSGIAVEHIDELRDTYITIGCYRETHRLKRMLTVFEKALTLARRGKIDKHLLATLVSVHDHKGMLTVTWRPSLMLLAAERQIALQDCVLRAWADENECEIEHQILKPMVHA